MAPDTDEDGSEPSSYASPACSAHEVDPAYMGLPVPGGSLQSWRKAERERLIAARLAMAPAERDAATHDIAESVEGFIGPLSGRTVSFYWPFRGEPDLRRLAERVWQAGGRALLPVVIAKARPLVFRPWRQGEPLERGIWNIPVPSTDIEEEPDVVIAPVVGYDASGFRLGYGGGFFDRTLAARQSPPLAIGVGYGLQKIETIRPQTHDIPMSAVVTELGIETPRARRIY